ncbi:protein CutA isoform X1 [Vombatus ursinus]|uniref:Protein CutA n=2 Tax=Vombatus ursinus TaxID=29139 RepID=A0A4X2LG82_VOMUR|nr:protein CutA isoform X1 [Vombatus ursinus]
MVRVRAFLSRGRHTGCMLVRRGPQVWLGGVAALFLAFLCMQSLLSTYPYLRLLPRAISMATRPPEASVPAPTGSDYVAGSVSVVFVTCPNDKIAKTIARAVVEKRLAACVNLIPQITSIYEWKGKIEEDSEVMMMMKTQTALAPPLTEFIRSVHPYEVVEVITLPVQQGNLPYLHWVKDSTTHQ